MAGEPQDDCLFCKIVAGNIPATIVRETETTIAFRDINPQAPTHVLVIPKAHYRDAAALAHAARRNSPPTCCARRRRSRTRTSWRATASSSTPAPHAAGQTVWHAHAHVVGGRGLHWPPG